MKEANDRRKERERSVLGCYGPATTRSLLRTRTSASPFASGSGASRRRGVSTYRAMCAKRRPENHLVCRLSRFPIHTQLYTPTDTVVPSCLAVEPAAIKSRACTTRRALKGTEGRGQDVDTWSGMASPSSAAACLGGAPSTPRSFSCVALRSTRPTLAPYGSTLLS